MKDNQPTKSISRKINRSHILHMISVFLLIDILMFVLISSIWCYNTESSEGNKFNISSDRSFSLIKNIPEDFQYNLIEKQKKNTSFSILFPKSIKTFADNIVYIYKDNQGNTLYKYSGNFFSGLFSLMYIITAVQIIEIISVSTSGSRKIRKHLAPLDEIAFKAQILGNTVSFDSQAFEELEKAINDISPAKEGATLHTGNTEMEHLEKAINELLERMRESYRQQARFVSDASHELRTPISILQGYVNMLDRWGKSDKKILDESIDAIKSETEHMKNLVEHLLFLARGDSGKIQLNIKNFSLNGMMREVYEESSMIDPEHNYSFKPADFDIIGNGDISMLKQTARILIDNAVKYTPKNACITLKTCLNEKGEPTFIIQDEGIGMSPGDVSHIFERFFRSDPARNKDKGGAGLGLSIAKWIVDRHGGYFSVISREDIGTRISVTIPFHT